MIPRKLKSGGYSKKYLGYLTVRDFNGKLKPDEIPIAKANGLLKWDLMRKVLKFNQETRGAYSTAESWEDGIVFAPVFDGYGKPDDESKKYIISNYEELAELEAIVKTG